MKCRGVHGLFASPALNWLSFPLPAHRLHQLSKHLEAGSDQQGQKILQ